MEETHSLITRAEEVQILKLVKDYPEGQKELGRLITEIRQRVMHYIAKMPRIQSHFGTRRYRVLGADLFVEGRGDPLQTRKADVAIYDYERDLLVSIIVDLKQGSIVSIDEHSGYQTPPSPDEVKEATTLALKDRSVSQKASGRNLKATASLAPESTIEGHPSRGHRVLSLILWSSGKSSKPLAGPILVDLSQQKLVESMLPLHRRIIKEANYD